MVLENDNPRFSGVGKCVKFLMSSQMNTKEPAESHGSRSVRQMKQLVGLLFNTPSVPATVPEYSKSRFYVHQRSPPPSRPLRKHNACAHKDSITSKTSTDSAFVSGNGEFCEQDSPSESIRFDRRDPEYTLPPALQQCSVTEKVQRWKETMADKVRNAKAERFVSSNGSTNTKIDEGSRDSIDSGLYSLSLEGHRNSLYIQQNGVVLVSPLNGDDTLTSVLSSLASDIDADGSDIEDHSEHLNKMGTSSTADSSLMMRCTSVGSCSSGGDDGQMPEDEITFFMESFVDSLFDNYEAVSQIDKAKFGVMSRTARGRQAFARTINAKRDGHQKVSEGAFLSLIRSMAVVLFECFDANDWSSAKVLMNMCFTFYTETDDQDRDHLYSHLASQPIWKSLIFWNSAFFEAILSERAKFNLPTATVDGVMQVPDKESQRQCLENITFSQLATFTHNMHAFGLPRELCMEFLEKQVIIGNLPDGQIELLQENLERIFKGSPN